MRIALSSGVPRHQVAPDLGVGLSTPNKWVQRHSNDDLMSGPHDDLAKENAWLRKENRLLKEVREVSKRRQSSSRAKSNEVRVHREVGSDLAARVSLPHAAGDVARLSRLAWSAVKPESAR